MFLNTTHANTIKASDYTFSGKTAINDLNPLNAAVRSTYLPFGIHSEATTLAGVAADYIETLSNVYGVKFTCDMVARKWDKGYRVTLITDTIGVAPNLSNIEAFITAWPK